MGRGFLDALQEAANESAFQLPSGLQDFLLGLVDVLVPDTEQEVLETARDSVLPDPAMMFHGSAGKAAGNVAKEGLRAMGRSPDVWGTPNLHRAADFATEAVERAALDDLAEGLAMLQRTRQNYISELAAEGQLTEEILRRADFDPQEAAQLLDQMVKRRAQPGVVYGIDETLVPHSRVVGSSTEVADDLVFPGGVPPEAIMNVRTLSPGIDPSLRPAIPSQEFFSQLQPTPDIDYQGLLRFLMESLNQ